MHLQSLELFGFKSFADKAVFNFHHGVTAIVGPNGCGKSNLLDAIRWVLGEQSAKSLRGSEMADVIFNGTDSRKPLGVAEVSLTFTGCAAELNTDWNEIRVTRRVYRDGNSDYLINKTPCRLRDIQNLFADTGVARAAYSMMEQGKIDLLLSSHPEDRRAVFEEAAGITKYKAQKREALRKLEATEANLLRIGDVIKEIKRQIGSLQRQAGKARRYQALHTDLRVLETHHSRRQLDAFEEELAATQTEIKRLAEAEQNTRMQIDEGEKNIARERNALDTLDLQIAEARNQIQALQSQMAAHRNRIELNQQRAEELAELIQRAEKEIAVAEAKRAEQSAQIQETDLLIRKSTETIQAEEIELNRLADALTQLRAARSARETSSEKLRIVLTRLEAKISAVEEELSGVGARRGATAAQIEALVSGIAEANKIYDKIRTDVSAARERSGIDQEEAQRLLAATGRAEEHLRLQQSILGEAERALVEIERTSAEKKSRLEILRQLNQEGRGLAEGSRALLTEMGDQFRAAVVAPLVSQLEVDPKFIAAIEAALGPNLHAIILREESAAPEIIRCLKERQLGEAALLLPPMPLPVSADAGATLPKAALAWAIDKVSAPEPLQPLIRRLLERVAVFPNLEQALEYKREQPGLAMATLAGEFVSVEGIVFGGSGRANSDSLLERKAEISRLETELTSLSKQRSEIVEQKHHQAAGAVEAASKNLDQLRERYHAVQLALSGSIGTISLLEREQHDAAARIEVLESERKTLQQQIEVADQQVGQLRQELSDRRAELARQQAEEQVAETAGKEASARESEMMDKLSELRLSIATGRQRRESLAGQRQTMAAREAELGEFTASRQAEISRYRTRLSAQAGESSDSTTAIEEQTARCHEAEANAQAIVKTRATSASLVAEHETALRRLRDSLSDLQDRRGGQQVHESQLQMQIENLAERISRRYQIDLRAFRPDRTEFERTLRVQLKKQENGLEAVADRGSAPGSRAVRGTVTDEQSTVDRTRSSELASASEFSPEKLLANSNEVALGDEDLEKLIAQLTRQLDNMGPVNLDAVQEYDELEERYQFLEGQNNDLTNSRRELLDVIARINSTSRAMFLETFAQVRANFREMFGELFGGGRADLSLLDENDPLNCGIEIVAKPPGKQLQTISLLSGGERAMTAVGLLFAIYMVRPSPFCVLDEIDAPLDESNINRFIRVLERFVSQSQFIIITHNKRTIAKADVLYGVTMEERGVSRLIGMRLVEPTAGKQTSGRGQTVSSPADFVMAENGHTESKHRHAMR